mgnify:CR=1 FL=1
MNYFAAHGLETWRCHAPLPGAKTHVLASVRLFSNEGGAILKVVYPELPSKARPPALALSSLPSLQADSSLVSQTTRRGTVETLVNQFFRAIEVVGRCTSRTIPLSMAKECIEIPGLVLGDDLASGIPGQIDISYSPQAVLAAPELKAAWWALVSPVLIIA